MKKLAPAKPNPSNARHSLLQWRAAKKQIFGSLFPKTWGHSTAYREPQQLVVRNADAVSSP